MRILLRKFFVIFLILVSTFILFAQSETAATKLFDTGYTFMRTGNHAKAIVDFEKIVSATPNFSRIGETYYLLGDCYSNTGNDAKAIASYRQVAVKLPGNDAHSLELRARSHYSVAKLSDKLKDYEVAEKYCSNFLTLAPKVIANFDKEDDKKSWEDAVVEIRYLRAETLCNSLKRYDDAEAEYKALIKALPDSELAYWCTYKMGVMCFDKGNTVVNNAAAVAHLDSIPLESEIGVNAHSLLAYILVYGAGNTIQNNEKAVLVLKDIIAAENVEMSRKVESKITLAHAYINSNNYANANETYSDLLQNELKDSNIYAAVALDAGDLAYKTEDMKRATTNYKLAAAAGTPSERERANYWLLQSYYFISLASDSADDIREGIRYGKEFVKNANAKDERLQAVYERLALLSEALYDTGDESAKIEAVGYYNLILVSYPRSSFATTARDAISRLTKDMSPSDILTITEKMPASIADFDIKLNYALQMFEEGNYLESVKATREILAKETDNQIALEARYLLGAALQSLGQYKDAAVEYKAVVDGAKGTNNELITLANYGMTTSYIDSGQYILAVPAARALLASPMQAKAADEILNEENTRKLYLATALHGNKQYAEAEKLYLEILNSSKSDKQKESAALNLAYLEDARTNYEKAVAYYADFLSSYPNSSYVDSAIFRKGNLELELGKYSDAVNTLKSITPSSSYYKDALYVTAWGYKEMGDDANANIHYAQFVEDFDNDTLTSECSYQLGLSYIDTNKSLAKEYFSKSFDTLPISNQKEVISYALGTNFYYMNEYESAANSYNYYITNFRNKENFMGALFWSADSLEKVEKDLSTAYARYKMYGDATNVNNDALGLSLDAKLGLARLSSKLGHSERSLQELQDALIYAEQAANSKNELLKERAGMLPANIQYLIGEHYFALENYQVAIEEYVKVTIYKYEPHYSLSYAKMAICSARLGNKRNAQDTLNILQRIAPDSVGAKLIPEIVAEYDLQL